MKRRKQYKYTNMSATALMLLILAFTIIMATTGAAVTLLGGAAMLSAFGTVCFLLWIGGTPWTAYRVKDYKQLEGPLQREWICQSNFYPVKAEGKTRNEARKNLTEALKTYEKDLKAGN